MDELKTWIEPDHSLLSVREQCRILNINRSHIYYTPREKLYTDERLSLMHLVDEIYTRYPFFSTRQMSDYITLHHHLAKRYEILFVYEKLGLQSTAPGPHTSRPHPSHPIYPYLLRNLAIHWNLSFASKRYNVCYMLENAIFLIQINAHNLRVMALQNYYWIMK